MFTFRFDLDIEHSDEIVHSSQQPLFTHVLMQGLLLFTTAARYYVCSPCICSTSTQFHQKTIAVPLPADMLAPLHGVVFEGVSSVRDQVIYDVIAHQGASPASCGCRAAVSSWSLPSHTPSQRCSTCSRPRARSKCSCVTKVSMWMG